MLRCYEKERLVDKARQRVSKDQDTFDPCRQLGQLSRHESPSSRTGSAGVPLDALSRYSQNSWRQDLYAYSTCLAQWSSYFRVRSRPKMESNLRWKEGRKLGNDYGGKKGGSTRDFPSSSPLTIQQSLIGQNREVNHFKLALFPRQLTFKCTTDDDTSFSSRIEATASLRHRAQFNCPTYNRLSTIES
jgi:hypothetical protein